MAYRVVYGLDQKEKKTTRGSGFRMSMFTAFFLALFLIIVNCTWPAGRERLQDIFLPMGSKTAFTELVSDIKEGEALSDAVQTFCHTIVDAAGLCYEDEIAN